MILGENNEKMSKSRGNVVNPDDIVKEFGADTFRTYEMFIGAFDQATPWSQQGVRGCRKFLERVWNLQDIMTDGGIRPENESLVHKMIKKVTEDIDRMKFNTAIASMMSFINEMYAQGSITKGELSVLLQLLNPTAPHITEEMWSLIGNEKTIDETKWPVYDEAKTVDSEVEIVLQINGKIKEKITVAANLSDDEIKSKALENDVIKGFTDGKTIVKVIVVKGKLVNIVVK